MKFIYVIILSLLLGGCCLESTLNVLPNGSYSIYECKNLTTGTVRSSIIKLNGRYIFYSVSGYYIDYEPINTKYYECYNTHDIFTMR